MDVNDIHPANACDAIDVTFDGMVIDARLVQLLKAYDPIASTFDVIFTVVKLVHPSNILA